MPPRKTKSTHTSRGFTRTWGANSREGDAFFEAWQGKETGEGEERTSTVEPVETPRVFPRLDLVNPWQVARQQSPTPFHQAKTIVTRITVKKLSRQKRSHADCERTIGLVAAASSDSCGLAQPELDNGLELVTY